MTERSVMSQIGQTFLYIIKKAARRAALVKKSVAVVG